MKVWGNAPAAAAWLSALVSDRLEPEKPFTLDDLLAVCEAHQIQMGVLFNAPTASDAFYRLFEKSPLLPWGDFASTTVSGKEEARQHGGEGARV